LTTNLSQVTDKLYHIRLHTVAVGIWWIIWYVWKHQNEIVIVSITTKTRNSNRNLYTRQPIASSYFSFVHVLRKVSCEKLSIFLIFPPNKGENIILSLLSSLGSHAPVQSSRVYTLYMPLLFYKEHFNGQSHLCGWNIATVGVKHK
jgi:hypothetical protein